jgi:hypothetical protein
VHECKGLAGVFLSSSSSSSSPYPCTHCFGPSSWLPAHALLHSSCQGQHAAFLLCSFREILGHLTLQPTSAYRSNAALGNTPQINQRLEMDPNNINFYSEFYCPKLPKLSIASMSHEDWVIAVQRAHSLLPQMHLGNPNPMAPNEQRGSQKKGTGGAEAVKPPPGGEVEYQPGKAPAPADADSQGGGGVPVGQPALYIRPAISRPFGPPSAAPVPTTMHQPMYPHATASTACIDTAASSAIAATGRPGFYPSPYAALPSAPPADAVLDNRPSSPEHPPHVAPGNGAFPSAPPARAAYPSSAPHVPHEHGCGPSALYASQHLQQWSNPYFAKGRNGNGGAPRPGTFPNVGAFAQSTSPVPGAGCSTGAEGYGQAADGLYPPQAGTFAYPAVPPPRLYPPPGPGL